MVTNPKIDLAVTLTASAPASTQPGVVATGGFLNYTITVTNNGPDKATGVTLTDTLPTGVTLIGSDAPYGSIPSPYKSSPLTITVGDLNAGETRTYHLTTTAPSTVPSAPIANKVQAQGDGSETDTNPNNSTAIATSTVQAGINLAVTSQFMPSQPVQGQETVIYIYITNQTSTQATNVVLTDSLPQNFQVDQITTTQGTVNATQNGVFTVDLGTLPPSNLATDPAEQRDRPGGDLRQADGLVPVPDERGERLGHPGRHAGQQQHVGDDGRGRTDAGRPGVGLDRHHGTHGAEGGAYRNSPPGDPLQPDVQRGDGPDLDPEPGELPARDRGREIGSSARRTIGPCRSGRPFTMARPIPSPSPRKGRWASTSDVQLTVNGASTGGVSSASGVLLDGAGNGTAGSNYVTQIVGYGPVSSVSAQGVDAAAGLASAKLSTEEMTCWTRPMWCVIEDVTHPTFGSGQRPVLVIPAQGSDALDLVGDDHARGGQANGEQDMVLDGRNFLARPSSARAFQANQQAVGDLAQGSGVPDQSFAEPQARGGHQQE